MTCYLPIWSNDIPRTYLHIRYKLLIILYQCQIILKVWQNMSNYKEVKYHTEWATSITGISTIVISEWYRCITINVIKICLFYNKISLYLYSIKFKNLLRSFLLFVLFNNQNHITLFFNLEFFVDFILQTYKTYYVY